MIANRIFTFAAFSGLGAAIMAPTPTAAQQNALTLEGRCDYAVEVADIPPDTGLALCRYVVIDRAGEDSSIRYLDRDSKLEIRYDGVLTGDTMANRRIQVGDRPIRDASGECTITRRSAGEISVVWCSALSDRFTFAANFVRKRW